MQRLICTIVVHVHKAGFLMAHHTLYIWLKYCEYPLESPNLITYECCGYQGNLSDLTDNVMFTVDSEMFVRI